jgi:hypothetical protein
MRLIADLIAVIKERMRSGLLISFIGESEDQRIGNSVGMCMVTSKMPKPR